MNRKLGVAAGAAVLAVSAGPFLSNGVAFADEDFHDNEIDQYSRDYDKAHQGGQGAKGGKNKSECLVPLGLSLGAVASTGGNVDQCNSRGGNGGNGGAGDVDY